MNTTQQLKKLLNYVILCQHLCQIDQKSDSQLSYDNYMLFSMIKMSPDGLVTTEKAAKRFSDLENKVKQCIQLCIRSMSGYEK